MKIARRGASEQYMKRIILAAAVTGLFGTANAVKAGVHVSFSIGVPVAPIVVAPPPVYAVPPLYLPPPVQGWAPPAYAIPAPVPVYVVQPPVVYCPPRPVIVAPPRCAPPVIGFGFRVGAPPRPHYYRGHWHR